MQILKDRFENTPVVSLQTGTRIAQITDMIIDPRQLKVVGFYCDAPGLGFKPAILNLSDIREIGAIGIIVDSVDVFTPQEDLVRLKSVLDANFKLLDKKVVDTAGRKLGVVVDFSLDSQTLFIVKLHVRPGFFAALKSGNLIIDRSQIEQVADTEIIVNGNQISSKETAKKKDSAAAEHPLKPASAEGS